MSDPTSGSDGEREFYARYYRAVAASRANALYCERLYGQDFSQHGFAEVSHLDHLAEVTGLGPASRVLDVGCGTGGIAAYLAARSGAQVTGVDLNADAVKRASTRKASREGRLDFCVMHLAHPAFRAASFDAALAIDILYFAPLDSVLPCLLRLLRPGGQLAAFWTQSCMPWEPLEDFDRRSVQADHTELAVAVRNAGARYQSWDYAQADYDHARRKAQIADALRADFEAEGNAFLYENHRDEARGVIRAYEGGAHGRYLYRVWRELEGR